MTISKGPTKMLCFYSKMVIFNIKIRKKSTLFTIRLCGFDKLPKMKCDVVIRHAFYPFNYFGEPKITSLV